MQTQSQERISQLAYQLWQERGCPEGSPEVDWERACRMLETVSPADNEVLLAPAAAPQGFATPSSVTPQKRMDDAVGTSRDTAGSSFATDGAGAAAAAGTTRSRGKGRSSSSRRTAI